MAVGWLVISSTPVRRNPFSLIAATWSARYVVHPHLDIVELGGMSGEKTSDRAAANGSRPSPGFSLSRHMSDLVSAPVDTWRG